MDRCQEGQGVFHLCQNYLLDTQHGIIVYVEATRAIRLADIGASRMMIDRTEQRFGIRPK